MIEELIVVLKDISSLLRENIPLEEEKLKAVRENKVAFVEDCMLKEQAILLKMRGLEKKREQILKDGGCEGKTLREISADASPEDKTKLQPVVDEFITTVQDFNSLNEESMKLIRLNLHQLSKAGSPGDSGGEPYGRQGEEGSQTDHFISELL